MLKRKGRSIYPTVVVLMIVFAVGLVLGTVSYFCISNELINEARASLDVNSVLTGTFQEMFINNFMMEIIWIISIWILGSINITAPLAGTILSLRGFFVGFSVAFAIGGNNGLNFTTCYIIPQSLTAFPLMTFFSLGCIMLSSERKHNENVNVRYLVFGIVFLAITALSSVAEVCMMRFFISYL